MTLVPSYRTEWDWPEYRRRFWRDYDWELDYPHWSRFSRQRSLPDLSNVTVNKEGFEATVDVHLFKSYEISVKTVGDTVVLEAKHDKRPLGNNFVGRHIVKRFVLPKGYDPRDVTCTLSSDGILTIKCPPITFYDRSVYVRQTGLLFVN